MGRVFQPSSYSLRKAKVPSLTESSPSPVKMASTEMVHEASVKAIAKSNGDFTQKLYNLLVSAQGKDENMVASPFSISAVMAMAFAGAKGDTADQMKSSLWSLQTECLSTRTTNSLMPTSPL